MSRTDREIHQLARDCVDGKIFGSWHGERSLEAFTSIDSEEKWNQLREAEVFHLFEYRSKALSKTINDMPVFTTYQTLSKYDAARLDQAIHRQTRHKTQPVAHNEEEFE